MRRYLSVLAGTLALLTACGGNVLKLGDPDNATDGGGKGDSGDSDSSAEILIPPGPAEDDGGVLGDGGSTVSIPLPSTSDGGYSGPAGWIVFDSDRDQLVRHLFAVRTDGSGLTQITSGTSTDTEPAISPDGKTLAFTSDRAGGLQIFVMDVATQTVKQLTTISAGAGQAAFSPDGKTIAFHSNFGVSLVNADGSDVRAAIVSRDMSYGMNYEHPVFTPDGKNLVVDRLNEIDAFDLSGSSERSVVGNTTTDELYPAISQSALVVFVTGCFFDINDGALVVTSLTGTLNSPQGPCGGRIVNARNLGALSHPSWGPGTFLTCSHASSAGLSRILILDASTPSAEGAEILQDNGNQQNPVWAPASFDLSGTTR